MPPGLFFPYPVCVCFLRCGRTCVPALGAVLLKKLSPEFLLFGAESRVGENCLYFYPAGIAISLNPASLQRDISADEFTADFLCAVQEQLFFCCCFVRKAKQEAKKTQANHLQLLIWLNAEGPSSPCPCWCAGRLWTLQELAEHNIGVVIRLDFHFQDAAVHFFAVSQCVSLPNVSAERKLNLSCDPASVLQLIKAKRIKKSSQRLLNVGRSSKLPCNIDRTTPSRE